MKRILLAMIFACLPWLALSGAEPTPAESRDGKATTMRLDKIGNRASMAREGRHVHLIITEAVEAEDGHEPKFVQVDSGVCLTILQAKRLAELLSEAVDDRANVEGKRRKADWLHLTTEDKRRREYFWRDERPNGTGKPLWFGDVYGRGFSNQ